MDSRNRPRIASHLFFTSTLHFHVSLLSPLSSLPHYYLLPLSTPAPSLKPSHLLSPKSNTKPPFLPSLSKLFPNIDRSFKLSTLTHMGYSSSSSSSLSPTSSSGSLVATDLEAGFSGHPAICQRMMETYFYKQQRFLSSRPPPRAAAPPGERLFFCDSFEDDEPHYFLESCFFCKKSLAGNGDIFMYRGDTPFCSEECREEQIEIDEAMEKLSFKSRKELMQSKNKGGAAAATAASSPPKSRNRYQTRPGTVVAG